MRVFSCALVAGVLTRFPGPNLAADVKVRYDTIRSTFEKAFSHAPELYARAPGAWGRALGWSTMHQEVDLLLRALLRAAAR